MLGKSCSVMFTIALVLGGSIVYFATNPRLCGYANDLGEIKFLSCDCYGIKVKGEPDAKLNILNGSFIYCYGITKGQICDPSGNADLDKVRREVCK
jgi:hypothetical protein